MWKGHRSFSPILEISGLPRYHFIPKREALPKHVKIFYVGNLPLETAVSERILNYVQRKIQWSASESSLALESQDTNKEFKCFLLNGVHAVIRGQPCVTLGTDPLLIIPAA